VSRREFATERDDNYAINKWWYGTKVLCEPGEGLDRNTHGAAVFTPTRPERVRRASGRRRQLGSFVCRRSAT
jgi:hypothetical protein